ncbi:MAG TPA: radical SAM protein [bacterium]|nr:radical SAM protein [bacterium]
MRGEQRDYFESNLEACNLCPRKCGVNRRAGQLGACRAGAQPKVASHCIHVGEEPPISGSSGSGTIFFSHCTMACVYCQNYPISQLGHGNLVEVVDLAQMMLELQGQGAHNINLVTATHFLPHIVEAIDLARARGLKLPIVYNDSGYELPETIRMLNGIVQVYLADMRYASPQYAARYSGAQDYPQMNRLAIGEMLASVGHLKCRGCLAESGLVIRHLVLPSLVSETAKILEYISSEISKSTAVSLMSQYFPANRAQLYPEINRKITRSEHDAAVALLDRYGLCHGWIQDYGAFGRPVA